MYDLSTITHDMRPLGPCHTRFHPYTFTVGRFSFVVRVFEATYVQPPSSMIKQQSFSWIVQRV